VFIILRKRLAAAVIGELAAALLSASPGRATQLGSLDGIVTDPSCCPTSKWLAYVRCALRGARWRSLGTG
jgi:hypothetical protein